MDDKYYSRISLLISIGALFISFLIWNNQKNNNKILLEPIIELQYSINDSSFQIIANNKGFGPAKIKEIEFYFNEIRYTNLNMLYEEILHNNGIEMKLI